MKLLRAVVALALLVGALGRSHRSKQHLHHHPTAVLLGERQHTRANVSLEATTDKLQGVLDKVSADMEQVLTGLTTLKESCLTEVSASAKRVQAQAATNAELQTTRLLNLERTAGLEASLANLVAQETDAHSSYESSVSQRATALQTHLNISSSTVAQAKAIGSVLDMMKKKRAQITASQTNISKFEANVPVAPTSSGSGLDFVIGVLSNIEETSTAAAEKGAIKHNQDDAALETLVTSYKTSLQHIDKQYQTENSRRMQAKVLARDSAAEKTLRNMLVDGEEKLSAEHVGICGTAGNGGSVVSAYEAASFYVSTFKQQTTNALNIMDPLPDLVTLQIASQERKLRGSPASSVLSAVRAAAALKPLPSPKDAQESAARWVMEMAAKSKDKAAQGLAKAVAKSFPHGVPQKKAYPVRTIVPHVQLHTLVGTRRTGNSTTSDAQAAQTAAILQCIEDKQTYTDQIIAARQAARVARTDKMSAEAHVESVKTLRGLAKDQKVVLTSAKEATEAGWKPLRDIIAKKQVSIDLTDAGLEMLDIQSEVEKYIAAGGPPSASGLPAALKAATTTLSSMKARIENDMGVLDGVYTSAFMISYPALINQLTAKDGDLEIEASATSDAVDISEKTVKKEEQAEKDLMTQRAAAEYRCMSAGTCGNLHYQQCCSGSGTFSAQVNSWKECQDHCEGQLKAGQKIVGCSMVNLYKEDDRTGSGTCYAQTTCTLAQSTSKCAGSQCKPSR